MVHIYHTQLPHHHTTSQTTTTMSPITEEARRQANLKLLQKTCDANIRAILQSATHVVLYEFKDNTWSKCGVEGSAFLVATPTVVRLIILNRHSKNNFILNVTTAVQVQDQDPFLILQETQPTRTSGLWFHSADERVSLTAQLKTVLGQLANNTFVFPAAPAVTVQPALPNVRTPAEVTQDERDHLSALLGGLAAGGRSQLTPKAAESTASAASPSTTMPNNSVALDKKALQLTLLSLIQDERFLDLLHSQYLRVVHARANKNIG